MFWIVWTVLAILAFVYLTYDAAQANYPQEPTCSCEQHSRRLRWPME
jgi:hypothetical protein